jgi:hypothetical protein
MSTKNFAVIIIQLCFSTIARGQVTGGVSIDSVQKLSFSGSIDTYYHRSFKTEQNAPRTSFANLPGVSLGMINFVFDYSGSKTGFVTDLVFGPRGTEAIFNAPRYKNGTGAGSSHMINQMYVYYNVNAKVRLNVGQMNTFVGYETITPLKNVNYSTSYLFSFGPFNHTGVWADLKFNEHCSAKVALMNPTDYTEFNPFNLYTAGGQLSITNTRSMINLNLTYGDPDGQLGAEDSIGSVSAGKALLVDVAANINVAEKYAIGMSSSLRSIASGQRKVSMSDQAIIARCGYYGIALYQTISLSGSAKVALRTEHFTEFNQGIGAIGTYTGSGSASVLAVTLSGNFSDGNLRFIPEVRIDKTSTRSFVESASGTHVTHMTSVNLALIYQIPLVVNKLKI